MRDCVGVTIKVDKKLGGIPDEVHVYLLWSSRIDRAPVFNTHSIDTPWTRTSLLEIWLLLNLGKSRYVLARKYSTLSLQKVELDLKNH